jgi:hypothetical protein
MGKIAESAGPDGEATSPETATGGQRYPKLETLLSASVHARLQAASVVLGEPAEVIVERALEADLARLSGEQRELVDRLAASLIRRSDL